MRAKILSLALASIVLAGCSDSSTDVNAVEDTVNNQAPNAIAGADQSVNEGVEVSLDGSSSSSPNGYALSYSWQQTGASTVSLTNANSATASFVPDVSADAKLTFELTVTDSVGSTASDEVIISVNNAPTASVSVEQQSGAEGASIFVSGELSSDSDSDSGSIASYAWSQLAGTEATFSSADEASTTITLPLISADENLSFQLLVSDNQSASATTAFTITVLDDTTIPVIASISVADGAYGIDENLTITIAAANDETGLALQSGSRFNGQELSNFTAVADQDGTYTATYTVTSGDSDRAANSDVDASITLVDTAGNLSEATTRVTLGASTSIDANAPTAKAGNSYTVNEAAEVELNASNSFDAYEGSIASYSWQQIEIDEYEISLESPDSSETNFTAPADLSTDITLTFQLTVADSAGNSDTDAVEVRVNNAPTANAGGDSQVNEGETVPLNGSGSSDTGDIIESYSWRQVADIDGNSLSSGALELSDSDTNTATFTAPPVDQDTTLYFQLTVTDGDGASDSAIVTISVNNNPTVTLDTANNPTEVNEGANITLSGSASDSGGIDGYVWEQIDDDGNVISSAEVTLNNDQATATFTAPSVDQDTTLYFQLTATDDKGGTDNATATVSVNNSPTITLAETKEVNESTDGVSIAATVTDVGGSISSYSWIEVDSSGSEVNPSSVSNLSGTNTNEITFSTPEVNQDTTLTFQLTVTDNDDANHTDSIVVTINNAPTAEAGSNQEVNESSDSAPIQVTLSGGASSDTNTDSGSSIVSYSWVEVDSQGQQFTDDDDNPVQSSSVTLTNANTATPTFTAPEVEVNESNEGVTTLTFQLTITDNDGATHSDLVEIAIHNLPIIDSVYLINGAYGIDDTATIYIQAGNSETGLTLKEGSSFNELKEGEQVADGESDVLELTSFSEIGDGLYSATYKVLESHASVADEADVTTSITLVDQTENKHESITTTAVPLDGEYIDTVRPEIDEIIIADGAYGADAKMTLYIQVANNEAGLVVKEDSNFSFNNVNLTEDNDYIFTEIGSGIYQSIYTILEGHTERADGTEVPIAITLTDPAGNDSTTYTPTDSFVPTITLQGESIDTSSPEISITSVGGDDNITNSSEVDAAEIIGTTTDVEDGQTVTITVKDSADPSVSAEITTTVTNNSFSADINLSTLADGDITVTADVSDAAGNAADAATGTVKKDTEAPAQTIDSIALSADTGTSTTDFITNTATQTITATLSAALGDDDILYGSVNSHDSGDVNWTDITNSISTENGKSISWTTTLTSGSIQFKVVDAAGNDGVVASQAYTLDTTIPSIDTLVVADGGDGVINSVEDDAVEISGTTSGAENGQTVNLTITNNNDASITTTTTATVSENGFSTANSNLDLSDLADGTYTVTADVSDIAGNPAIQGEVSVKIDATEPSINNLVVADDNTINSGEAGAVTISGTASAAETGRTISFAITDSTNTTTVSETTSLNDNGTFSATVDLSNLADGTYTVTADVSDAAGNAATQASVSVRIDTAMPSIDTLVVDDGGDGVINSVEDDAVSISGTTSGVEAGEKVTLKIDGTEVGTATVDSVNESGEGIFSVGVSLSGLADGDHILTADVSDVAGNAAPQAEVSVTLDTTAPSITALIVDDGGDSVINSAEAEAVPISGTTSGAETGRTISFAITGGTTTASETASVNEDGTFNTTVDLSNLADGDYEITADVSDVAGNTATQASISIKIDTTAPSINTLAVAEGDVINSDEISSVSISGTTSGAETGQTISFAITDGTDTTTVSETASVDDDGAFSAAVNLSNLSLNDGDYTVTADVSDEAGNAANQVEVSVTIDTTAPSIITSGTSTTVDEAGTATLDASESTDNGGTGIDKDSYSWVQVESNSVDIVLYSANNSVANFDAPGIVDGSVTLTLDFKFTVADIAGNSASSTVTITINNTYTTPLVSDIPGAAPDFNQLTLSWPNTNDLNYSLYRSTQSSGCTPSSINFCANGAEYNEDNDVESNKPSIGIDADTAIITDTDLALYTTYYYWLEAKLGSTTVLLDSDPTIAATTSGPGLNDTGVVDCDANNGGTLINEDCEAGRDFNTTTNSDDDGHAGFSFTRLNSDGTNYTESGTYSDKPWFCVLDNVTGLIWEVKDITTDGDIRDTDTQYTWYSSTDTGSSTGTAGDGTNFNTEEFITEVNSLALCSQSNWRLPTASELLSITNYSVVINESTAAVDSNYFANMQGEGAYYWTNTLNRDTSSGDLWLYSNGSIISNSTDALSSKEQYAILVSSTATSENNYLNDWSDDRYQINTTDNGSGNNIEDGTVTDTRTGLMWMRCVYDSTVTFWNGEGCNEVTISTDNTATFYDAFGEADTANSGTNNLGHTDWRLPNIQELYSLLDHAAGDNSTTARINATAFPNARASSFWSSTPEATDGGASASNAYYVDFSPTAAIAVGTSAIDSDTAIEHSILLVRDITD